MGVAVGTGVGVHVGMGVSDGPGCAVAVTTTVTTTGEGVAHAARSKVESNRIATRTGRIPEQNPWPLAHTGQDENARAAGSF